MKKFSLFGFDITRAEKRNAGMTTESYMQWINNLTGGHVVNQDTVQGIAAWGRGRSILSNTIAGLPKNLYEKTKEGRKIVDSSDKQPSIKLIKQSVNDNLTSYQWHDYMMGSVLDYGNAYSVIYRNENNTPLGMSIVHPDRVEVKVYDNTVIYTIKTSDNNKVDVAYEDMYHIMGATNNGYIGINPIKAYSTTLALSLAMTTFARDLYTANTNLEGYIKMPGKLDKSIIEKTRESWKKTYGGNTGNSTAFLDQGMEYVPLSMTPENAQLIQMMRYTSKNIALMLGLPAHMINEMDEAKYNNVELTGIEFVKYSLMPWVQKFEIENNKLLRYDQQGKYQWKYNVNGLMRGDAKSRSEFYNSMVNMGAMTPNQVRELEDMNPYDGGNEYYIQGNNMIPVSKLDDYYNTQKGGQNEQSGKTNI